MLQTPAIERFVIENAILAGAEVGMRVGWLGEHFRSQLLGITEEPVGKSLLRMHLLGESAHDSSASGPYGILEELGGPSWAPVTFGQLWHTLKKADRRAWYMAYVQGTDGRFYGVHAGWSEINRTREEGLHIESGELNRPYGWAQGMYVISR